MTPKEHLAVARAELNAANDMLARQGYTSAAERILLAQAELLLALVEAEVAPKSRFRRARS